MVSETKLATFRLTIGQFQQLLEVLLAPEAPEDLSNRVLMACTRPHDGIISVPLPAAEAELISRLVDAAFPPNPSLAATLREQVASST